MRPLTLAPGVESQKRVIFHWAAHIHVLLCKAAGKITHRVGVLHPQGGGAIEHESDASIGVLC